MVRRCVYIYLGLLGLAFVYWSWFEFPRRCWCDCRFMPVWCFKCNHCSE